MVEVEFSAPPLARKLKPRRVSAKRAWPKGCGRFATPADGPQPPAPLDLRPDGSDKDTTVAVNCNGSLPLPLLPLPVEEEEEKEVVLASSSSRTGFEGEKENGGVLMVAVAQEQPVKLADATEESAVVAPPEGSVVVVNGVLENGGQVGALVVKEKGGGSEPLGSLEVKRGNDDAGSRKRWLVSVMHPPPKRRAVSAKRTFPLGCERVAPPPPPPPLAGTSEVVLRLEEAAPGAGSDTLGKKKVANGEMESENGVSKDERAGAQVVAGVLREGASVQPIVAQASVKYAPDEKTEGERSEDEGVSKVQHQLPESQVAVDVAQDDAKRGKREDALLPSVAVEASVRRGSDEKLNGKRLQGEGKSAARLLPAVGVAEDDDMARSKREGGLQIVASEASARVASDEKMKGKRLLESDGMNGALSEVAVGVFENDEMKSKTSSMKKLSGLNHRKGVRPPVKVASLKKFAQKLKRDGMDKPVKDALRRSLAEEEAEHGSRGAANQIEEDDSLNDYTDRLIVQALMARDKCPWMQGRKSIASVSHSLAPRKKLNKEVSVRRKLLAKKAASSSKPISEEKREDEDDSKSEDDENSKALVVYEGKRELCVNLSPCVPSEWCGGQSGNQHADAWSKVRRLLKLFQLICRKLLQGEEAKPMVKIGRIDLEAGNIIKQCREFTKPGPIIGNVPGVEVGDEFHYRVELSIVGLHRPYQGGIDTTRQNGVLLATSIVASGGYPDELSSSDVLTYTGSGGKPVGKKEAEDQKLERGNLALKNSIEAKTPVRVIHGFKGLSRNEPGDSRAKQISTFTYDGLYMVEACWQEGDSGSKVFKYRLRRIPGQPELALHIVKKTKKSKVREGLRLPDISKGKERIPICVINTIDDELPAPFKYITNIIYPPWYAKQRPQGCDCTNGCSDSARCACAVKNGGEIPFNFNGAIVQAKPLIYECGPSCRCPPTCHNRVSQRGIKIPLEIFKTDLRGWGVRSLNSIPSGSFICEYVGELLQDKEAEQRSNDEYLFDIGHNYDDQDLWEGLPSIIPGLPSSSCCQTVDDQGFTIDAAECGNVGRFINHSCSPNLYAQNVLYDHDDKQMPHIMFFAAENIPPLQELTYHYNYTIGQVRDAEGNAKIKNCYCGSPECCGRLY